MIRQHPFWQSAFLQAHSFWLQSRGYVPGNGSADGTIPDHAALEQARLYGIGMADLAIRGLLDAFNIVDAADKDAFERGVASVKARFDLISGQFDKVQAERDQLREKLTAPEGYVSCYVRFVDGVPEVCVGIEALPSAASPV